jgi:hypothetical protein
VQTLTGERGEERGGRRMKWNFSKIDESDIERRQDGM